MLNSQAAARIAISLAACWLLCPTELAAQSSPQALVVVAKAVDADFVRRIGRQHVHVEPLFSSQVGALPGNYEACDKRAQSLLGFRLFVVRDDSNCPRERFWRARMTATNPQGKVHRLERPRLAPVSDCEHWIQQATAIHGALSAVLPEHRASLDANLRAELRRLSALRRGSLDLAVLDDVGVSVATLQGDAAREKSSNSQVGTGQAHCLTRTES